MSGYPGRRFSITALHTVHTSPLTVRVLGCGDAFGSGGRFQTCFHVHADGFQLLIDCGASSLIAMKTFGVDPDAIDMILVSHLHGDHFGGIPFLDREICLARTRTRPLVVAGPLGIERALEGSLEVLFPGATQRARPYTLDIRVLHDDIPNPIPPLVVHSWPVVHAAGTNAHALRIEIAGRTIAYSGDTAWTDVLIDVARGADLFICEAYTARPSRTHMDLATLVARRGELDCGRLLLTHLGADLVTRLPLADFDTAVDGMMIEL